MSPSHVANAFLQADVLAVPSPRCSFPSGSFCSALAVSAVNTSSLVESLVKYTSTPDKKLDTILDGKSHSVTKIKAKPSLMIPLISSSSTSTTGSYRLRHPPASSIPYTMMDDRREKDTNDGCSPFNIPPYYQTQKQQHFLQGIKLNDCRYNIINVPSPPSPIPNKTNHQIFRRRRFSISSMTTTSRPLRDLASDPNLITNKTVSNQEFDRETSLPTAKVEKKKSRNSLCHLASKDPEKVDHLHGKTPLLNEEIAVSSHLMTVGINQVSERGELPEEVQLCRIDDCKHSQEQEKVRTVSICDSEINSNNQKDEATVRIDNVLSDDSDDTQRSNERLLLKTIPPQTEGRQAFEQMQSSPHKSKHFAKHKKRRQSSIGVSESSSHSNKQERYNLPSLPSPGKPDDDHVRDIPQVTRTESKNELKELSYDQPRHLFPKMPDSDAKQIGPILHNARKLVHEYTSRKEKNNSDTGNYQDIFSQINTLTGYVVTPPLEKVSSGTVRPPVHTKLELWNRVGPALKHTDKIKNETAAAVEEVTQTRIERVGQRFRYFNLHDKKGKKPIDPKDYEARYAVMLEEVSAIRSQCWNTYFGELQHYCGAKMNVNLNVLDAKASEHGDSCVLNVIEALPSTPEQVVEKKIIGTSEKFNNNKEKMEKVTMEWTSTIPDKCNSVVDCILTRSDETKDDVKRSDSDCSELRSPLSLDADAYRVAKKRCSLSHHPEQLDCLLDLKAERTELTASANTTRKRENEGERQHIVDDDDIQLSSIPSRDMPSDDPDIAQAERQLWKELDEALERYSKKVVELKNRKKRQRVIYENN